MEKMSNSKAYLIGYEAGVRLTLSKVCGIIGREMLEDAKGAPSNMHKIYQWEVTDWIKKASNEILDDLEKELKNG